MSALLLTLGLLTAEPALAGPEHTVRIGYFEPIHVLGLTTEEWDGADIDVYPSGYDVTALEMFSRDPAPLHPVILFRANETNPLSQYDVVVTFTRDGKHDRVKIAVKVNHAPQPPPVVPDEPDDPDTETEGPVTANIFQDAEETTADIGDTLIELRTFSDSDLADPYIVRVYDLDPTGEDGRIVPQLKALLDLMPQGAEIPYAFLTKKKVGANVVVVLWKGPLTTADSLIAKMKELADGR